jgi:hypothetical protein
LETLPGSKDQAIAFVRRRIAAPTKPNPISMAK